MEAPRRQSLPQDVYLHAVREDPKKKGQLYLGTERGVMFSTDGGETWRDLRLNLPTVAVHDLVVKDDDLVVATHGRSIWILDDLRPIREFDTRHRVIGRASVPGRRRDAMASRQRRIRGARGELSQSACAAHRFRTS